MNLRKCRQCIHYPYFTNSNSVLTTTTSKMSCMHLSLLCLVITSSLPAPRWSADCNTMAACMGWWFQGCMTLPWYWGGFLDVKEGNNLHILERQILRKIFGPVNIDNIWRIWNNMKIDKLTEGADIVRFMKAQRIKWLEHIQRINQARPTRKLLDWKPMGIRPVGRPRLWQEDVTEDLKKLKVKNWKETD